MLAVTAVNLHKWENQHSRGLVLFVSPAVLEKYLVRMESAAVGKNLLYFVLVKELVTCKQKTPCNMD